MITVRPAGAGTAIALNNAAWAWLTTNDPSLLDEADALSREAQARAEGDAYVDATRGTVLLKMGKTGEAAPLLDRAWRAGGTRHSPAASRAVAAS